MLRLGLYAITTLFLGCVAAQAGRRGAKTPDTEPDKLSRLLSGYACDGDEPTGETVSEIRQSVCRHVMSPDGMTLLDTVCDEGKFEGLMKKFRNLCGQASLGRTILFSGLPADVQAIVRRIDQSYEQRQLSNRESHVIRDIVALKEAVNEGRIRFKPGVRSYDYSSRVFFNDCDLDTTTILLANIPGVSDRAEGIRINEALLDWLHANTEPAK